MNQLVPSPSLLAMQGHHGVDNAALYGRDDVWLPFSGQKALMCALLLGLRPTTPQYRGGQLPLREPQVCLPAFEEMGVVTQDGAVPWPVLSAEVDSVPSQPSGMIDVPVAEEPLSRASGTADND